MLNERTLDITPPRFDRGNDGVGRYTRYIVGYQPMPEEPGQVIDGCCVSPLSGNIVSVLLASTVEWVRSRSSSLNMLHPSTMEAFPITGPRCNEAPHPP